MAQQVSQLVEDDVLAMQLARVGLVEDVVALGQRQPDPAGSESGQLRQKVQRAVPPSADLLAELLDNEGSGHLDVPKRALAAFAD